MKSSELAEIQGQIHSLESFGAVDGPGIRYVVFLQGCRLRCVYCHNPDTWNPKLGTVMTAGELTEKIVPYEPFLRKGGVTFSGGEPLLQSQFVYAASKCLHEHGFHVAIDTAGSVPLSKCSEAINEADLLLLDIKALEQDLCSSVCGMTGTLTLELLNYCQSIGKSVWLRHVCVPDLTLKDELLEKLAEFASGFSCIQRVELMGFHQMGRYKWEEEKIPYSLNECREPTNQEMEHAREIFRKTGLKVH